MGIAADKQATTAAAAQTPTRLRVQECAIASWIHLQLLAINTLLLRPQNASRAEISIDDSCAEVSDANDRLHGPFYSIHGA
jgi:hypothetical protein